MRRVFWNHLSITSRLLRTIGLATVIVTYFAGSPPGASPSSPFPAATREDATKIATETVQFDSNGFDLNAFLAKPAGGGIHSAVLVIHDNQGLNDHIRQIAEEFAAEGFVALAPDFSSRLGGTKTPDQIARAVGQLSPSATMQDARAALAYLQKSPEVDAAKVSTVGFGWGGWRSFTLAVTSPDLYRAVIYCGTTPLQSIDGMHAAVLAHYAEFDFRTTGNALLIERTMTKAGKKFAYYVYQKANRNFYAPGVQYNPEATRLAWTRTLDFLEQ